MSVNQIDGSGIQIQTYADIISQIINGTTTIAGLIQIYGPDINVDSNTPDGQLINIFTLSKQDVLQLCVGIYNSFNPDAAVGIALDALAQFCGISRKGGTYTQIAITITTDRSLNLNGLDSSSPFTVADQAGNQFQLIASASLIQGTNNLNFQAVNIGYVQTTPNTITTPITYIPGVLTINNAAIAFQVGTNQETDSQFRLRRQQSTAVPSQGVLQGLIGGLYTISGILQAVVYENQTDSVDANGVPAHAIWVITNGGATADIANMIYKYRSQGCNMKGATTYSYPQIDGTSLQIAWDVAASQNLYIHITVHSLTGAAIDSVAIKAFLANNLSFDIFETADVSTIISLMKTQYPNLVVTACQVSGDNSTFTNFVSPSAKNNIFAVLTGNITVSTS